MDIVKSNINGWTFYFYGRSVTPIPYEEVEDDSGAVDLETFPPEIQTQLQSEMPQFFVTPPDPEKVEFEELSNDVDFLPMTVNYTAGISPFYKRLLGIRIPEFKVDLCKKTFKTPWGKVRYKFPCLLKRTSDFNVYAYLLFPTSLEQFIKDELKRCFNIASGAATTAGVAVFWGTPGTPIERVLAAIPVAAEAFKSTFLSCVKSIPSWDTISRNIDYGVSHEQVRLDDWH